MIIKLKVSPLSKKILQRDYGYGPIRISKRNFLYPLLQSTSDNPCSELLTDTIDLDVSKPPSNYSNAGINFHRYHMDKLIRYILSQHHIDVEAYTALRNFFKYYDLTDEEYEMDTAYRQHHMYY